MADAKFNDFDQRVSRVVKKHRRLSRGYTLVMNEDGLITARPVGTTFFFPWRFFVLFLLGCWAFKIFLYISLGTISYQTRLDELNAGSALERAGGWVMQIDPATLWVAEQLMYRL